MTGASEIDFFLKFSVYLNKEIIYNKQLMVHKKLVIILCSVDM